MFRLFQYVFIYVNKFFDVLYLHKYAGELSKDIYILTTKVQEKRMQTDEVRTT